MSLIAALMLLQGVPAAPAAGPPEEDFEQVQEITVIAQKLRQISVNITRDPAGKYQCGLSESTGLLKLDGALCEATTQCVRKGKVDQATVRGCVEKARPALTARIRDHLVAQRAGAGA